MDYKNAYLHLFNRVSDTIDEMEKLHQEAEEICISQKSQEKILTYPVEEKREALLASRASHLVVNKNIYH